MPSRQLPQRWLRLLSIPILLLAVFGGAQRCQAQPTPSLEPLTAPAALAVVRAVHLSGDYKQAIRLYQQVQSQAPQSEAAVEAMYRQGQAAFAAGDTAAAISSSLQLVIHPRAGRWQAPGLLLLGHAFRAFSGAEDAALAVYDQYEALEGNLADVTAVRKANLLFRLGRDDAAWEVLAEAYAALDAIPSRAGRGRVARAFGHRAGQAGRTREAAAAFRTVLADLPRLGLPITTHIQELWRHVEREEAAGRRDLADEVRQALIREYPRSFQALQALRTSGNRFPISDDDRTAIYYANGLWRDAIATADDFHRRQSRAGAAAARRPTTEHLRCCGPAGRRPESGHWMRSSPARQTVSGLIGHYGSLRPLCYGMHRTKGSHGWSGWSPNIPSRSFALKLSTDWAAS